MTKVNISRLDHEDIKQWLSANRLVAIMWGVEDVQSVRPDLDDTQSWEVLQECAHCHDCELGFNWSLIETVADNLFPEPDTDDADEGGSDD